jgi:quercetin dioxygenase-like cupin family protein
MIGQYGLMKIHSASCILLAAFAGATVGCLPTPLRADAAPPSAAFHDLLSRDLNGVAGKELRMLTVEYIPGGASLAHRHNAQVFVYVLQGSVRMQVQGSPLVTLGPGDTFYEGPDDIHTVSANASATEPARILVFMVKDKAAPVSSPVAPEHRP